jgi:UDP-N-acetylglucosamine transferase subunit ALG13
MITSQIRFGITTILVHKFGKGIHSRLNRFKIYGFDHSKQMKMAKRVILPQCNK